MTSPEHLRSKADRIISEERNLNLGSARTWVGYLSVESFLETLAAAKQALHSQLNLTETAKEKVKKVEDDITEKVRPPLNDLLQGTESDAIMRADRNVEGQEIKLGEIHEGILPNREERLRGYLGRLSSLIEDVERDGDPSKEQALSGLDEVDARKLAIIEDAAAYKAVL